MAMMQKRFAIGVFLERIVVIRAKLMIISVKKNLVVKQIANMYDSPNKLLKFGWKIAS